MVRIFTLDKVLKVGTKYRTHPRVAYKILKVGTDATSAIHLKIDGKELGDLVTDVAPMYRVYNKINGLLDISRLFYTVPPDTDFEVEGPAGAKFRVVGNLYQLAPGEAIPGELIARFNEQPDKHIQYVTGTYSFGAATSWSDGTEVELFSLTPATIEKYVFNDMLMLDYTGFSVSSGDVVVNFYIDNNPIEYLESTNVKRGIDFLSMPHQADYNANQDIFSLKDFPIELLGDHTLSIRATNVKGSGITLSSASITLYGVVEYYKLK